MDIQQDNRTERNPDPAPPRWKRLLISGFVAINLLTVAWINQPDQVAVAASNWIDGILSTSHAYRLRYAAWQWNQYAHHAGLDNRWQMFGFQSRFNWWYDIRAVYSDGLQESSVLLPLPNQSARTLAERLLFDLKERKFELNIYRNPVAREAYSRYLARQFPTHEGMPISSVRWHLGSQRILPPAEAVSKHQLHDTQVQILLLNDFKIGSVTPKHQEDLAQMNAVQVGPNYGKRFAHHEMEDRE